MYYILCCFWFLLIAISWYVFHLSTKHAKVHGAYCLGIFQNGKDPTTLLGGIINAWFLHILVTNTAAILSWKHILLTVNSNLHKGNASRLYLVCYYCNKKGDRYSFPFFFFSVKGPFISYYFIWMAMIRNTLGKDFMKIVWVAIHHQSACRVVDTCHMKYKKKGPKRYHQKPYFLFIFISFITEGIPAL